MAYDGSLIFDTKIDQKSFEKGLSKLGGIAGAALKVVGSAIVGTGAALVGIGTIATKVGSEFEAGMSQLGSVA